jgi:hypothetical protein
MQAKLHPELSTELHPELGTANKKLGTELDTAN